MTNNRSFQNSHSAFKGPTLERRPPVGKPLFSSAAIMTGLRVPAASVPALATSRSGRSFRATASAAMERLELWLQTKSTRFKWASLELAILLQEERSAAGRGTGEVRCDLLEPHLQFIVIGPED